MPSNHHIEMMPPRESNALNYKRREWLKTAQCPFCDEGNVPPQSDIITLNEDGTAVCGACAKSWRPQI